LTGQDRDSVWVPPTSGLPGSSPDRRARLLRCVLLISGVAQSVAVQPASRRPSGLPVEQLDVGVRLHDAPNLQVHLDLPSLLLGTRSIWPAYVEISVARGPNDETGALEVRAQVVEQGWVAGS
jgi:hypothetical protein